MERRNLFKAVMLAGLSGIVGHRAKADEARAMKVVYHLSDADKTAFVLGNLRNHRAGGPVGLQLPTVLHGTALPVFRANTPNQAIKEDLALAMKDGVTFYACANTLKAHDWTLADLLPGFLLAENGGVVKLADMQAQGWVYLRP